MRVSLKKNPFASARIRQYSRYKHVLGVFTQMSVERIGLSVKVDAGSTRSVQKIVMLIIVEKKNLVSDFTHFHQVLIGYVQLYCILKRFFKHNTYRCVEIFCA